MGRESAAHPAIRGPAGWTDTSPAGNVYRVTMTSGLTATGENFGDFKLGAISGTVFNDLSGTGTLAPGDPDLAGWTVYLDANNNGALDPGEVSTVTAANGTYSFTGLGPGTYNVREVAPSGWTETSPPGNVYRVTMTSGLAATGENFGDFKLGAISGTVFNDLTGTGKRATIDLGLAGWTVYLDANNNGVLDPGEVSTVTAANGTYSFTGLGPGTYYVREVAPSGWTETSPAGNVYRVTMTSALTATGENFGDFKQGTISGTVFNDLSGTGKLAPGDPGLAGWTVYLDANDSGVLTPGDVSTVTAANGTYSFAGLGPGTYYVREVAPSGWTETSPPGNVYRVTMTSGLAATGENFGDFKQGAISGTVSDDPAGTGTLTAADPGLTVQPANLDANDSEVLTPGDVSTVTAANGTSSFTGLGPGTYNVVEVVPAGWVQTTPAPNAVTMTSGLTATGENFGDQRLARTWSSPSACSGGKQVWLFDESNGNLITPGSNSVSMDSIKFDPSQWQNSATDTDDGSGDWIVDL